MYRNTSLVSCLGAALLLAGCQGPIITSIRPEPDKQQAGLVYYLPKQLVKVEVTRALVPPEKAKDLGKTLGARDAQADVVTALEKSIKGLVRARQGATAPEVKNQLEKRLAQARAQHEVENNLLKDLNARLNQMIAEQQPEIAGSRYTNELKFTLLPPVADTSQRYVAVRGNRRGMRSDDLKLSTNTAGLLSSGDVVSIDQTGSVIVEWINSIGAGFEAGAAMRALESTPVGPARESQCPPFRMEAVFDPTNPADLRKLGNDVAQHCPDLKIDVCIDGLPCTLLAASSLDAPAPADHDGTRRSDPEVESLLSRMADVERDVAGIKAESNTKELRDLNSGIYYRRALPRILTVHVNDRPVQAMQLEIPNGTPAERLALDGVRLGQADHDFTLVNGMLTEHRAVLPSSAVEVAKLPGKILKAIIEIPASIVQLKIDTTRKQTELTQEQLAYLSELARLEAEQARRQAAQDGGENPGP